MPSCSFSGRFDDPSPIAGEQAYWVRVRQSDGAYAWSSPIFVTLDAASDVRRPRSRNARTVRRGRAGAGRGRQLARSLQDPCRSALEAIRDRSAGRAAGAGRDLARRARERVRRAARAQRMRQDDAAQHHRRAGAGLGRSGAGRRQRRLPARAGQGRGLPAGRAVPLAHRRAERRVRSQEPRRPASRARNRCAASCLDSSVSPAPRASIRSSCPVACSSAWRSRARSRSIRRSC